MNSLKENISWSFLGNVTFSASQWLIISIITKFLGVESLGNYALALAIVSPVFTFANMSLRSVQSTDVKRGYAFADYFWFRTVTSSIAILICCGITIAIGSDLDFARLVSLLIGIKLAESFADLYFGMYQKNERLDLVGKSLIFRSTLIMMFVAFTVSCARDLEALLLAVMFAYLLVFFGFDRNVNSKQLGLVIEPLRKNFVSRFYELFILLLPLGVTVSINVMYQSIPRYLVEYYHGAAALGTFAGVSYFLIVGSTIANAMGQSALPRLAIHSRSNPDAFKVLLIRLVVVATTIGLAGVAFASLFSDTFLSFVYTREFLGQGKLFTWVMFLSTLMYISGMVGTALSSIQQFRVQAYISILCAIILLATCYVFIQPYGPVGAAYAMVIAYTVKLFCEVIGLTYYYEKQLRRKSSG